MRLDWLIIGGGIHGVHIAARLLGEARVAPDALRIIDPANRLLMRWRSCTKITGMTHLRSPVVHHLDLNPWSLKRFASDYRSASTRTFAPPYDRPALDLFDAHCDRVVEIFGVAERHIQDRVVGMHIGCEGVSVRLSGGDELKAGNIVLAIGASEQPRRPAWAPTESERVQHVFEEGFDAWPCEARERVAVVGGGISAGQVALRLKKEGHDVHLVSRHALRQHQFDSDPGWLGPKYMSSFGREPDLDRRRAMIVEARHQGSVPPDIERGLRTALAREEIRWHEGEVEGLVSEERALKLRLTTGESLEVQRVLLATGFRSERPGGAMLDELIASASLPCADCGYPIVDASLRWHPRVHVCGPLAELELGPASRNIAGARRAGDRLVSVARAQRATGRWLAS